MGRTLRGPPGSALPRSASTGPGAVAIASSASPPPSHRWPPSGARARSPGRAGGLGRWQPPGASRPRPANGSSTSSPPRREELDEPGHQAWWLVGAVGSAVGVAQLGGVGRRPERLGEVQPLLAGQLVQRVVGVHLPLGQPYRRRPAYASGMAFVGRERELARLAAALQRAVAGRPSRVVLTGTAGAGVTRLLDELTARVETLPEVVVVRGASVESAVGEPYQPPSRAWRPPWRVCRMGGCGR